MPERREPSENEVRKERVAAECPPCMGTGVIPIVSQKNEGVGMECPECDGKGKKILEYVPFRGRKDRTDITIVKAVEVSMAPGLNPVGEGISYEAFQAGKRPTA